MIRRNSSRFMFKRLVGRTDDVPAPFRPNRSRQVVDLPCTLIRAARRRRMSKRLLRLPLYGSLIRLRRTALQATYVAARHFNLNGSIFNASARHLPPGHAQMIRAHGHHVSRLPPTFLPPAYPPGPHQPGLLSHKIIVIVPTDPVAQGTAVLLR